jgi:hypothetical protein
MRTGLATRSAFGILAAFAGGRSTENTLEVSRRTGPMVAHGERLPARFERHRGHARRRRARRDVAPVEQIASTGATLSTFSAG